LLVLKLPAGFPLRFIIAAILGVLHSFAFMDDNAWPLQIATLAGLLAQISHGSPRDHEFGAAARAGLAFGLGWFLAGTHWIYISLHTYGEMAAPLAAMATVLLCAYIALFPALACGLHGTLTARLRLSPALSGLLVFPALWMLSEWLRGELFTGYPWLASGYAHVASPLTGYAPLIGVYGLAMLAAMAAGALTLLGARQHPRLAGIVLATVVLVGMALGRIEWGAATGKPVSVRLLQGNIAQDLKFDPNRFGPTVETYLRMIEQKPADLIILPETALPRFLQTVPIEVMERLVQFSRNSGSSIAFGVPVTDQGGYFNSVVAITPEGGPLQRYDKSHLVPFGEFIPWGFQWFVNLMNMPLGSFARGSIDQQPMTLAGLRVAFNICYEDLFGAEIARQAKVANVLVNVSNVAWFGNSLALPQHLQISRMRSIETARPMLRATNTGMTAAIDARGTVLAALEPFTAGSLDLTIQPHTGTTPYVLWRDTLPIGLALLCLALAIGLNRLGARRLARTNPAETGPV